MLAMPPLREVVGSEDEMIHDSVFLKNLEVSIEKIEKVQSISE